MTTGLTSTVVTLGLLAVSPVMAQGVYVGPGGAGVDTGIHTYGYDRDRRVRVRAQGWGWPRGRPFSCARSAGRAEVRPHQYHQSQGSH